ncbi:MAG: cupin domain-containing protein [Deltaproteobacteria bacterium]|nr:cupin domain-containing protein [Deltaproteobacteria bacterium]
MDHLAPQDLEQLLSPISVETFVDDYLERQPLHVPGDPHRFSSLFRLDDVDELLARGYFQSDDRFGVFRDGQRLQPPFHRAAAGSGRRQHEAVIASWVRERHLAGDTVVAYAIDGQFPTLRRLARAVGQALRARVDIGLYLTPNCTRGLAAHWDYMDVMVLQLEGTKRWQLHGTGQRLPVKPRTRRFSQSVDTAETTADVVLSPGDLLYLPRGTTHQVTAEDRQSLHLTVGIHRPQWHELLGDLLYAMAPEEIELRRSVPIGDADRLTHARALLRRCADRIGPDALTSAIRCRTMPDSPLPDRQLDQALASETAVEDETRVVKREGVECFVESVGDRVQLAWPGSEPASTLRAPHQVTPALQFIARARGSFAVQQIPDAVTSQSKRVLVSRLIRAGVLKPVA